MYPRIPASAPPAEPSSGSFGSNVPSSYPSGPTNYPSVPSNYPSTRPSNYPSNPSNYPSGYGNRDDNRNNPYPNPFGNRDPNANHDRDNSHRGGSSSSDDSGGFGSTLLNLFTRGGGSTDRYGSGGSSSSGGIDYGSIYNALAGGNRPSSTGFGNNGGSNGLSGILSSFGSSGGGNRNSDSSGLSGILSSFGGSSNRDGGLQDRFDSGGNTNYDNRRQQPTSSDSGSGSGFLSSLSSFFGSQIGSALVQNALSGGNRGQNDGASGILSSIQNRRYGGLFNENTGHAAGSPSNDNLPKVTVSGSGPGGYPTQAPAYPRQAQTPSQAYPNQAYANDNQRSYTNSMSATPSAQNKPAPYGWTVGQH